MCRCCGVGTSLLKSLQQKLIRFRPKKCTTAQGDVDARVALLYVFLRVLASPPQFVPTIQASVNGVVNAFKRLLVQAYEDSDPFAIGVEGLNELAAAALLGHHVPEWFPSDAVVGRALQHALALQAAPAAYAYSTRPATRPLPDYRIAPGNPCLPAVVLRSLRAFQGDMAMLTGTRCVGAKAWPRRGSRWPPRPRRPCPSRSTGSTSTSCPTSPTFCRARPTAPAGRSGPCCAASSTRRRGVNPRRVSVGPGFEAGVAWARKAQRAYSSLVAPPEAFVHTVVRVRLRMSKAWFAGATGPCPSPEESRGAACRPSPSR